MKKDRPGIGTLPERRESCRAWYPLAGRIQQNVPVYDASSMNLRNTKFLERLQAEFQHNLIQGPGLYVIENFFMDKQVINTTERACKRFVDLDRTEELVETYNFVRPQHSMASDFVQHAKADQKSFVAYYSNMLLKVICTGHFGSEYRLYSRSNGIGRTQQQGFSLDDVVASNNECQLHHLVSDREATRASAVGFTLRGIIAHSAVSQKFGAFAQTLHTKGKAHYDKALHETSSESRVNLQLRKGDAAFYHSALVCTQEENGIAKSWNWIDASPMEGVGSDDTQQVIQAIWELLRKKYKEEGISAEVDALIHNIAASAGIHTRTRDMPSRQLISGPNLIRRGLEARWSTQLIVRELESA